MNRRGSFRLMRILIAAILPAVTIAPKAADIARADFSGAYALTGGKGSFKIDKSSHWLLDVVQNEAEIKVTKTVDGKATTNTFRLDGTEAPYTSEGGVKGTCTARFKGRTLVLDNQGTTHPQPSGPAVAIHTREQWTLSRDSKTLTIRTDVDFPKSGLDGFQVIEPWSEIYTRNPR